MKIDVQHIPPQGMTLSYEKPAKAFAILKEMMERRECDVIDPISIELDLQPEKDTIRIRGRVATTLRLACSRCLVDFNSPLKNRFTLRYSRQIPQDVGSPDATDVELTAEQIGLLFFRGDEIDPTDAIAEQVILALPYKPLCDEACKGLCPHCGIDLNHRICRCSVEPVSSPFDVLKNFDLTQS